MNKKIITIAILTLSALVVLTLFSFGPLSSIRKKAGVNPVSLNPVQQPANPTQQSAVQESAVKTYNNVDVTENYYQISLPQDWQVGAGSAAGDYTVNFSGGNGEIRLMDVPDNTTLELYVLSQEEPRLKKSVQDYQRKDYQKITVNSNEAYKLIYSEERNQNQIKTTVVVYVAGQDQAGVMSFSTPSDNFSNLQPTFDKVINSFNWQNR